MTASESMSVFNEIDLTCGECGEEFRGTIWTAVHAKEDPELKELLLGGELNLVMCPECGQVAYHDHFVLYQDPAAELIAYIYPLSQQSQADTLRAMMLSGFKDTRQTFEGKKRIDYEPVLLFGLAALIEMMEIEAARAAQSQIAQIICQEKGIDFTLLRPSEARQLGIMRAIPKEGKNRLPSREGILKGLEKILKINPALDLYAQLCKTIQSDVNWKI
jgi:hypothetical protein